MTTDGQKKKKKEKKGNITRFYLNKGAVTLLHLPHVLERHQVVRDKLNKKKTVMARRDTAGKKKKTRKYSKVVGATNACCLRAQPLPQHLPGTIKPRKAGGGGGIIMITYVRQSNQHVSLQHLKKKNRRCRRCCRQYCCFCCRRCCLTHETVIPIPSTHVRPRAHTRGSN